jgi:hypothetical protein
MVPCLLAVYLRFRKYLSFVYDRTARLLVTDLTHVAQEMDFLTLQFVQYRERMCVCHGISLSCNFYCWNIDSDLHSSEVY